MKGVACQSKMEDAEVLLLIREFIDSKGYSPSVLDLVEMSPIESKSTMHRRLLRLRKEGFIQWSDGKQRTMRVL